MSLEFENQTIVKQVDYLKEEPVIEEPPVEDPAEEPNEENPQDPFGFDLFGNPISDEKKAKATPSTNAKKPEKVDKLYDTEWLVFYAGHRLTVPEDGLTLEQIRGYLELEFPELSKERTEMLTDDDKKQIIPVVKGAKKG